MKTPQRSKSLQIYVKPGIREDDLLIDVWDACSSLDRPQDVFRTMLRRGLIAMVESGEMPEAVIDQCGLDILVERRKRKSGRSRNDHDMGAQVVPVAHPGHYPPYQAPQYPMKTEPFAGWVPQPSQRPEYADYPPGRGNTPQPPVSEPERPTEAPKAVERDNTPPVPQPSPERANDKKPETPNGQASQNKKRLGNLM